MQQKWRAGAMLLLGAAVVSLCFARLAHAQELPGGSADALSTIRKQVDEVNLTFTVTNRGGRFVHGLTREDISIVDDEQPPTSVHQFQSQTDLPLRLCVVIDTSDSIAEYMRFQQEVAAAFLHRVLRPAIDSACLVKFAHEPYLVQNFTGSAELLESSIRRLTANGDTAVWDAVRYTSDVLKAPADPGAVRRVLILITDGEDNASHVSFADAIEAALRSEVAIHVISTRQTTALPTLDKLARATGGMLWGGASPKTLTKSLVKIEEGLRSQYFVAYQPAGTLKSGQFRRIKLRTRRHGRRVVCRSGYFVPLAER